MKKIKTICLALALGLSVSACSQTKTESKKEVKKIGIIQIVDHPALNTIKENLIQTLEKDGYKDGDNIQIDYQNAQGDQANLKTIATKLAKESDYIVAIATPSAQAIAAETSEIPTVFSAITDPVEAGLVDSMEKPGHNFTGTSDAVDIEKQLSIFKNINPNIKKIGLIYNAGEANSKNAVDNAKKVLAKMKIETKEATVASTNDIKQAMTSLATQVDGIYVPIDNTMASGMASVSEVAKQYKIPVVAGANEQVKEGGLATYGVNQAQLGVQTAKMLEDIITGKSKTENTPVQTVSEAELYVNEDMAKALNIDPKTIK
ncbi:ABC transporter substrate binding protein [Mycoplasma sp. P36-A1]|uniref:ABC transporter substrate binding protein n=1 Tax=Mycoplasma sp. P36-A1 TaxID=3252900 RepID=UPI003C2DACA3